MIRKVYFRKLFAEFVSENVSYKNGLAIVYSLVKNILINEDSFIAHPLLL